MNQHPARFAELRVNEHDLVRENFDHGFFKDKYRDRFRNIDLNNFEIAFSIYQRFVGIDRLDPNPGFSENFYLLAYPDVQMVVQDEGLLCGFQHWLHYGRVEGRRIFQVADAVDGVTPELERKSSLRNEGVAEEPDSDELMLSLFDLEFFYDHYAMQLMINPEAELDLVFDLYLLNAGSRSLNPSPQFSEDYYFLHNPDVREAVSAGAYRCGFEHWALHGQGENRAYNNHLAVQISQTRLLTMGGFEAARFRALFQFNYYIRQKGLEGEVLTEAAAFERFLQEDLMSGMVPVDPSIFDESFYTLYYADVAAAKSGGLIPSGYYHYVLAGRAENRQPIYNMGKLLSLKLGDAAEPVGLSRVRDIGNRLRPVPFTVNPARPVVMNVFIPTLDGDIMFGGYIAFLHFLCRLAEQGQVLRFIIMEDQYGSAGWFKKFLAARPRWNAALADQEVVNATTRLNEIEFNPGDICIAYSCWTAHDAWSVARHLNHAFIIFFIQEYEPVFHENDSVHFMMSSFYDIPHLAIFNSDFLMQYFRSNRLGVFSTAEPMPFLSFRHALADVKPNPAHVMRGNRQRRLICYARPEKHAARNLFEVCILALRSAIEKHVFDDDWAFFGIGSLGKDYEIPLSNTQSMQIVSRVAQADYERLLQSFDVGLSLMWAPHPSVIPFELAKAGVVTVTNTYGIRDEPSLAIFGANIVPAAADLESIVDGLRRAVAKAGNPEERLANAAFDWPTDWDAVFDAAFFKRMAWKLQHFSM